MGRVHLNATGERTGFWRDSTRLQPDFCPGVPNAPDAAFANRMPISTFGLQLEPGAVARGCAEWQARDVATIDRVHDPRMKLSDDAWPSATNHPPFGTLKGWPLRDDPTAAVALKNSKVQRQLDPSGALRLSDIQGRRPDRFNGAETQSGSGIFPVARAAYDSPKPRDGGDPGFLADGVMYGTERSALPNEESRSWPMGPAGTWSSEVGRDAEAGELPEGWNNLDLSALASSPSNGASPAPGEGGEPSRQSVYKELRPLLRGAAEVGPPAAFRSQNLAPIKSASTPSSGGSSGSKNVQRQNPRIRRQRRRQPPEQERHESVIDSLAAPATRHRKEWSESWISSGGASLRNALEAGAGSPTFEAPASPEEPYERQYVTDGGKVHNDRRRRRRRSSGPSSGRSKSVSSSRSSSSHRGSAAASRTGSSSGESWLGEGTAVLPSIGGNIIHEPLVDLAPPVEKEAATEQVDQWLRTGFCRVGQLGAGDQSRLLGKTLTSILAAPSKASSPSLQ